MSIKPMVFIDWLAVTELVRELPPLKEEEEGCLRVFRLDDEFVVIAFIRGPYVNIEGCGGAGWGCKRCAGLSRYS